LKKKLDGNRPFNELSAIKATETRMAEIEI
jgi:hypothetical protein